MTITIINAAVGIAMGLAMWLTGVGDPILWGTVAFLLNCVPILGTALGALIFHLAGLLTVDTLWLARLHQLRGLEDAKVLKSLGRSSKGRHYRG